MKVKAAINVAVNGPLVIDDLDIVTPVLRMLLSNSSPPGCVTRSSTRTTTRRYPGLWCWGPNPPG
jgi:hypothetical protein